jgi:Kef-type K+ transport system membrane component KefB
MENITKILLEILLIFFSAKLLGEIFERFRQPAVIGEIIAGIIIGPFLLNLISPEKTYEVLAQIGIIILLFDVGLHIKIPAIMKVGKVSLLVAVLGVVFPFVLGFFLSEIFGHSSIEAMFVAAALVATSVGITARVFADLGFIESKVSQIVLGAAVIDDIIGMIVLAIVTGASQGSLSYWKILLVLGEAVGFVVFLIIVGQRVAKRFVHKTELLKIRNAPFILAIIFCLGLSALASYIDIAAIVGAFLAGLVLSEFSVKYELAVRTESLKDFLVPFFFVIMGTKVELTSFTQSNILGIALLLTLVAILGKLLGCGLGALFAGKKTALLVGVGMIPRGEVGMIVASLGLAYGAISGELYSTVVFMVIATTLITPPILRPLILKFGKEKETKELPIEQIE